jgi:hypothetical protein
MKIPDALRFAGWGWIGGAVGSTILGLVWPVILPGVVRVGHYYGSGPSILQLLLMAALFEAPAALVGGFIGGRLPREGGRTEQRLAAAIGGLIAAIPFAGYCFWFFSGW